MKGATTLTPVSAAEHERQISLLERQLEIERTRAVAAARINDSEVERAALSEIEELEGRLRVRRQALEQARLDEAAAAAKTRDAAIEQVAGTVLPRLEDEMHAALRVATRERTGQAIVALDLAVRKASALRSKLYELTSHSRFHPAGTVTVQRLLREDPALESVWQRVRVRGPLPDLAELYAGLPSA